MTIYYSKNNISLESACVCHLLEVAQNMRPQDRAELAASHPGLAVDALTSFRRESDECMALVWRGKTMAVFGLVPDSTLGVRACVWMMSATGMEKIRKTFFKLSKAVVEHWLKRYPELYNFTDERYGAALEYIRRLGGCFDGKSRMFSGHRFLLFHIRRQ